MKHISSSLPRTRNTLINTAKSAPVAQIQDNSENLKKALAGKIDWLFLELRAICPAWRQAFGDDALNKTIRKKWLVTLAKEKIFSDELMKVGLERVEQEGSAYFPAPSVFAKWCKSRDTESLAGIPSLADAFYEAQQVTGIMNRPPIFEKGKKIKEEIEYSHPIVKESLLSTGCNNFFDLPEYQLKAIFKRHYERFKKLMLSGEYKEPTTKQLASSELDENIAHWHYLNNRFGGRAARDFQFRLEKEGVVLDLCNNAVDYSNIKPFKNTASKPPKRKVKKERLKAKPAKQADKEAEALEMKFKRLSENALEDIVNKSYTATLAGDNSEQSLKTMLVAKRVLLQRKPKEFIGVDD